MSEDARIERRPPKEVFGLLGNETRIEILYALDESPGEPVSFSELHEEVGTRDSGQFNYHLGKLADHFVRKTEDGYELTVAGTGVVGALRAGRYTADVSIDPIELDDPCPRCGGTIRIAYEEEYVQTRCVDCDDWGSQFTVPPGTIEQFDREELPEAFDRWLGTTVERTVSGFCPNCSGRLEGALEPDSDRVQGAAADFDCDQCGVVAKINPVALLYFHPAAVSFYYDHGIDVRSTPSWELDRRSDQSIERLESDPFRIRVEIDIDDERLVATIDETATITSVERESV
ncbi:MAG: ArsR/SmtB family transcription factor [Halobacteriales archaeon]